MKLFFDEDIGKNVPTAPYVIGFRDTDWVAKGRRIGRGTPDERWLPYVGQNGYLLISCNKAILDAPAQRELLMSERVGVVFFADGQGTRFQMLRQLLNQWSWLEAIDATEPRPFAYVLSTTGRKRKAL